MQKPFKGLCRRALAGPSRPMFFILLATTADTSFACSCRRDMSAEERIRSSEHIYLGRVVDISPVVEVPIHASDTEFEVNIEVVETWRGSEALDVRASMNAIYNDPSANSRAVSSCRAPVPLGFRGLVILLTNDVKPVLSPCIHNVWIIEEAEVEEMRELISSTGMTEAMPPR